MKITNIETYTHWIEWCNWLFVKVSTDEGLYGWGEGSLHGAVASVETAIHELGAALIGQDPAGVERHWQALYHAWRWRGGPVQATALGALDIALWDLEGKRLGVPVYRLLGGPFRPTLRGYASHWLAGATTPEAAYEGAREAVRRGFRAFKWSPFDAARLRQDEARALREAAELMAAAREGAGPDVEIYVECAERLSPRTAVLAARAFLPYRPGWFEEPIPFENAAAMIRLQRELPVPIATGERLLSRWEYRELLAGGGCQVVQPDVMHAGGITEVRKIANLADLHYLPVAPHNPGGPICMLAAMHLAAAIPNFLILEQMEGERALRDALCTEPVVYRDGEFVLPAGPGLGTDLDLEALAGRDARPQPVSGSSESLWR
ncbi:MAG TPA: mandelate racemase/muconate lactonizing enzyme family protein [Thermomicrobiales bacterium]|nr:mandelate racemase/muconate lactonizing enzyme family protein [Thermomicrobiales bacterium]